MLVRVRVRVRVHDTLTSTMQGVTSLCIISFKWSGFETTVENQNQWNHNSSKQRDAQRAGKIAHSISDSQFKERGKTGNKLLHAVCSEIV